MLVKINPTQIVIVKKSLTETARKILDECISNLECKCNFDAPDRIVVVAPKCELYTFLYELSKELDIELM